MHFSVFRTYFSCLRTHFSVFRTYFSCFRTTISVLQHHFCSRIWFVLARPVLNFVCPGPSGPLARFLACPVVPKSCTVPSHWKIYFKYLFHCRSTFNNTIYVLQAWIWWFYYNIKIWFQENSRQFRAVWGDKNSKKSTKKARICKIIHRQMFLGTTMLLCWTK